MHLNDDFANDRTLEVLKNATNMYQVHMWAFYENILFCTKYKDKKRVEFSAKGYASKQREYWLILQLDREDITSPYTIRRSRLKVMNLNQDFGYSFDVLLGKKIKADEPLPYGLQPFWHNIQPLIKNLDISF